MRIVSFYKYSWESHTLSLYYAKCGTGRCGNGGIFVFPARKITINAILIFGLSGRPPWACRGGANWNAGFQIIGDDSCMCVLESVEQDIKFRIIVLF